MFRELLPTVALLVLLPLAAACGSNDGGDEASPTTAPEPTAAATTPEPTSAAAQDPAAAGALTSGTFEPPIALRAGHGWAVVDDLASAFVIEHDADVSGPTQAYVAVFRVANVRNPNNFGELQPVPDDFIAWLAAHKDMIVTGGPTDVTVAGVTGTQLDVRVDTEYDVPLFDDFEFHFRDQARFIELDVPGRNIVIAAGPFTQAYFSESMAIAEPVIATISFQ